MRLDERLAADCHRLGTLERATVLLHRHSAVGWLILVPDTDARDWHDLDDVEYQRVNEQLRAICAWTAEWFAADKMNVASLGNQVSQMHIHIIARKRGDACWPEPVWGRLPDCHAGYSAQRISAIRQALATRVKLVPA